MLVFNLVLSGKVVSQIAIDTTFTPEKLVHEIFLGEGIKAGNIHYSGSKIGIAYFVDSGKISGMQEGIILSTGNVYFSQGPNMSQYTSWVSHPYGDKSLEQLARGKTFDASVLEFDFITNSEMLEFRFVFGSEEYNEYVGSKFNDVFGFFINKVGDEDRVINVATIPETGDPVTVNSINGSMNKNYFRDNDYINTTDEILWDNRKRKVIRNKDFGKPPVATPFNIQYDGLTVVLTASLKVVPNKPYHIKLAIADVADAIFDSGVFLEAHSFRSYGDIYVETEFIDKEEERIELAELIPSIPITFIDDLGGLLDTVPIPEVVKEEMGNEYEVVTVNFDFDKFILSKEASNYLLAKYDSLPLEYHNQVLIIGHTDDRGSEDYNMKLSQKRSTEVAEFLKQCGFPADKIRILFYGENRPIAENTLDSGRAKNRRVEVYFTKP